MSYKQPPLRATCFHCTHSHHSWPNRFTQSLALPWKSKRQGSSIVWRLSFPRSRQEDMSSTSVRCTTRRFVWRNYPLLNINFRTINVQTTTVPWGFFRVPTILVSVKTALEPLIQKEMASFSNIEHSKPGHVVVRVWRHIPVGATGPSSLCGSRPFVVRVMAAQRSWTSCLK